MNEVDVVLSRIRSHEVGGEADRAALQKKVDADQAKVARDGVSRIAYGFGLVVASALIDWFQQQGGLGAIRPELVTALVVLLSVLGCGLCIFGGYQIFFKVGDAHRKDLEYMPLNYAILRTMEPEVQAAVARWTASGPWDKRESMRMREHELAEQWDRELREARARADFRAVHMGDGDTANP